MIMEKNKQTIKIFEYRVFYTPVKGYEYDPEDPDKLPYDCRATLIGYKLMFVEPYDSLEKTQIFSLYDPTMQIIGTQVCYIKRLIINIPNIGATGWQFSSEVAKSGFF